VGEVFEFAFLGFRFFGKSTRNIKVRQKSAPLAGNAALLTTRAPNCRSEKWPMHSKMAARSIPDRSKIIISSRFALLFM
jgi:hypothetical protein